MKNPLLKEIGPGIQALLLVSLSLVGASLGSMLSVQLAAALNGISSTEMNTLLKNADPSVANTFKWMNTIIQLFTFVMPALVIVFIFGKEKVNGFLLRNPGIFLFAGIMYLFLSEGWVSILSELNNMLIPAGSWAESLAKPMEDSAVQLMTIILTNQSMIETLWALFTVAIVPAICEELFFRGGFQPLMAKRFKNEHIAIWSTAFLFSLYHFQFYGFLPRLLLGALLGYLVIWSGSLWTSILAHLANNLLAALLFIQFQGDTSIDHGSEGNEWINYALSFLLFGLFTYMLQRMSVWKRLKPAYLDIPKEPVKEVEEDDTLLQ